MNKVILYTIHKSGSMFLHQLLSDIASSFDLKHFSMNNPYQVEDIKQRSWLEYIHSRSGVFGPVRIFEATPNIPETLGPFSVILHTRDPRDILTSLYYSHTYSHKTWEGGFNPSDEKRKNWEDQGIDHFVLKNKRIKKKYQCILDELWDKPGVVHVTYEEMVTDYGIWLDKVLTTFSHIPFPNRRIRDWLTGPPSMEKLRNRLFEKFKEDFSVDSEDIHSHKRQITPGDYKRKLQPETIEQINANFAEILKALKYSED